MKTTVFLTQLINDSDPEYVKLEEALSKYHDETELKILEPYINYLIDKHYEYPHIIAENILKPEIEFSNEIIIEKSSYAIFYNSLENRISTPILTYWKTKYVNKNGNHETKNMSRFRPHATPIVSGKENALLADFFTKVSYKIEEGHEKYGKEAKINLRIHNGFVYERTDSNVKLYDPVAQELMTRIKTNKIKFLNDFIKEQ